MYSAGGAQKGGAGDESKRTTALSSVRVPENIGEEGAPVVKPLVLDRPLSFHVLPGSRPQSLLTQTVRVFTF